MGGLSDSVHSVRFRLTAWYGFLMIVFLVVAGFGAWTLLGNWLRADLDDQLQSSVASYATSEDWDTQQPSEQGPDNAPDRSFRSLVVQVSTGSRYLPVTPFDCQIPFSSAADTPAGAQQFSTQGVCGDSFRVLATTIPYREKGTGQQLYLVLAQSLSPLESTLGTLRNLMLAIGGLGILLALQGGWLIAGRALRPISDVTDAATTIAESQQTEQSLATRLPLPRGNDEVAQLTITFNRMLDRIEAEFGRRQRFVADASHELRTPLAAIRGNLDVLSMQLRRGRAGDDEPGDATRREAIDEGFDDLNREARRMARLLDDLLFLARADDIHGAITTTEEPVRLDDIAGQTVRSATGLATGQRLETYLHPVTVAGDRDRVTQVLWVLLDNALRHTGPGERIVVTVGEEDGRALLTVRDEGGGIAADDLPHVFDRFFRADESRGRASGGSGLGLAIAKTIVEQDGGGISATSTPGQGSTFTVRLPLTSGPGGASPALPTAATGSEAVATAV